MTKQPKDMTADELRALIGEPPPESHADEWLPRDSTWHKERLNWIKEVDTLRQEVARLNALLHDIGRIVTQEESRATIERYRGKF